MLIFSRPTSYFSDCPLESTWPRTSFYGVRPCHFTPPLRISLVFLFSVVCLVLLKQYANLRSCFCLLLGELIMPSPVREFAQLTPMVRYKKEEQAGRIVMWFVIRFVVPLNVVCRPFCNTI